jgi:hypothetical protein
MVILYALCRTGEGITPFVQYISARQAQTKGSAECCSRAFLLKNRNWPLTSRELTLKFRRKIRKSGQKPEDKQRVSRTAVMHGSPAAVARAKR